MGAAALTPPIKVGLTGGIGSGKSLVCGEFAALGVPVLDADTAAREIVAPGGPLLAEIVKKFGREAMDEGGRLRRDYLRDRVFADPDLRRALESLLHPRIRALLSERAGCLARHPGYCVICVPLLVECGWQGDFDRILVVDAPEDLRIQRVLTRDRLTRGQVEAIMRVQVSAEERLSHADDVIVNDGDRSRLQQQVAALHHRYLQLAHERRGR